ncbi:uncharacterized protein LOC122249460 [Penaeus japonicus]|uniref:uncharacterized protein LOC122249460 n=1 Tax=Penaeus japonicus TaxID=27405 RepID=UPI001C7165B5|nr:uncharacterized protein LOC122249460 [Penaeus japonicus]XP_042866288.1 uncharacterized protein LOC122249460 [Penaeus japonicus]
MEDDNPALLGHDSPSNLKEDFGRDDDQVEALLYVAYRVALPLMVVAGVLVTTLSLVVLTRPRLRATHVNMYFLLLASADLLIFVVSVATAVTLNGCDLPSRDFALYFAHFFFTLFYIVQTFSMYIILWISYDRFLAVWDFKRFHEIQKPGVLRCRLVVTLLVCVLIHLKHLFEVEVTCVDEANQVVATAEPCDDGTWIINDGLHFLYRKALWRQVFWVLRGLLVLVIPVVLVVVFNGGIVAALVCRRASNTAATARTRDRDLSRIYTILAIAATFIVCTVPSLVHATFYAENIVRCHGPYAEEVLRAVANLLLLFEHVTHFVILSFCELFWAELKRVLRAIRSDLESGVHKIAAVPARWLAREDASTAPASPPSVPSPRPDSVVSGSIFIISQPEITINVQGPAADVETPSPAGVEATKLQDLPPQTSSSLATLKLPPGKSPTASMVTLEEDL